MTAGKMTKSALSLYSPKPPPNGGRRRLHATIVDEHHGSEKKGLAFLSFLLGRNAKVHHPSIYYPDTYEDTRPYSRQAEATRYEENAYHSRSMSSSDDEPVVFAPPTRRRNRKNQVAPVTIHPPPLLGRAQSSPRLGGSSGSTSTSTTSVLTPTTQQLPRRARVKSKSSPVLSWSGGSHMGLFPVDENRQTLNGRPYWRSKSSSSI